MKLRLLVLFNFALLSATIAQEKTFTVTDDRDGKVYKAKTFTIPLEGGVTIERTWLLENASYIEEETSFCYKDEPAYCEKFGRLYTYEGALKACPDGYRIPTRKDWFYLFSLFGGVSKSGKALMEGGSSNMNLMLGGFGFSGDYYNKVGIEGNYWDSADKGVAPDGIITLSRGNELIHLGGIGKKYVNSCRCIKKH